VIVDMKAEIEKAMHAAAQPRPMQPKSNYVILVPYRDLAKWRRLLKDLEGR
jgi:hypothetical protein